MTNLSTFLSTFPIRPTSALPQTVIKALQGGLALASLLSLASPAVAQTLNLPEGQRWLEVKQHRGTVSLKGSPVRPAQLGDRIQAVGQGVTTGQRSSTVLAVDSNIGVVKVSESTDITLRRLEIGSSGGRVTAIAVNRGQAAFQVRPFTNPQSRLEIRTPSGVAGVRGTEFGVAVAPSGRTAVLTTEGAVEVRAQGQQVLVKAGYSSLIYPGEPPTPPRLTVENLEIRVQQSRRYRSGLLRVVAQVDPINLVSFQGKPVEVGRDGTIDLTQRDSQSPSLSFVVRSPLGNEREHTYMVTW